MLIVLTHPLQTTSAIWEFEENYCWNSYKRETKTKKTLIID